MWKWAKYLKPLEMGNGKCFEVHARKGLCCHKWKGDSSEGPERKESLEKEYSKHYSLRTIPK